MPDRATDPRYINTVEDFDKWLAHGPYAWPGGYPCYFLTSDGETMSFKAAQQEAERIREAIREKSDDGWRVVACDINWEDSDMVCCHTNEKIEAAYGDD
jgi:hypothetical protein